MVNESNCLPTYKYVCMLQGWNFSISVAGGLILVEDACAKHLALLMPLVTASTAAAAGRAGQGSPSTLAPLIF